jgi:putative phage-type endonuclease
MRTIECGGQGTERWFEARLGKLTASRISDAIGKAKRESTGELQARRNLKLELAVERITGRTSEHFVSEWMERGKEMEDLARAAYELATITTERVDLVLHPTIEGAAASPDGLVGDDGLLEVKVPKPTTHASYLLAEVVPEIYRDQMMWQMACTGRAWNDFVSWCPDFPAPLDLFIVRMARDDKRIAEMEVEAERFLYEVEMMVRQLKGGIAEVLRESLVPRAVIPSVADAGRS